MPRKKTPKTQRNATVIDVAKDHLYKISDPVRLAKIFFPNANAKHKRAAFLAIIYAIRNATYQKAAPSVMNRIPKKHKINASAYFKARSKMARIGIITKSSGYWMFSDKFKNAIINNLLGQLDAIRYPSMDVLEEAQETAFIESAKIEDIYHQTRRSKRY